MRTFQATMSSRGQVTVPMPVRDALNLRVGDSLAFDQDEAGPVRLRVEAPLSKSRPSAASDLSSMQTIARDARRSRDARPIDDYLIAEDELTKTGL